MACLPIFGEENLIAGYLRGEVISFRLPEIRIHRIEFNSNWNKPVVLSASYHAGKLVQFDENIYGSEQRANISLNVRMGNRLRGDFTGTQAREYLSDHSHFKTATA